MPKATGLAPDAQPAGNPTAESVTPVPTAIIRTATNVLKILPPAMKQIYRKRRVAQLIAVLEENGRVLVVKSATPETIETFATKPMAFRKAEVNVFVRGL